MINILFKIMDYSGYIDALNSARSSNDNTINADEFKSQQEEAKQTVRKAIEEAVVPPLQTFGIDILVKQIAKRLGVSEDAAKALAKGDVKGALKQALNDKVEQAKNAVNDTVNDVKDTVNDTVSDAKNAVSDTVNNVKDTVNDTVSDAKNATDDIDNIFGDEPDADSLKNLFDNADASDNPFSFKPVERFSNFNTDLDEEPDIIDAIDNVGQGSLSKEAGVIASRDADLLKFEPKIPSNKLNELSKLKSAEQDANQEFDTTNNRWFSDETRQKASDGLEKASQDVVDKEEEIKNIGDNQKADFKSDLNDKYNLDENDKLIEEPLEEEATNTVESGVADTLENTVSKIPFMGATKPGYSLIADTMGKRAGQVAEQAEQQISNTVDESVNSVKAATNVVENVGSDVSKTVGTLASDAEEASQVANKASSIVGDGEKTLSTLSKVGKVSEVLDEDSLADDWNPVGIGITLALTAGTVLAQIFGKKKTHNSPVPQESYTYQAGIDG